MKIILFVKIFLLLAIFSQQNEIDLSHNLQKILNYLDENIQMLEPSSIFGASLAEEQICEALIFKPKNSKTKENYLLEFFHKANRIKNHMLNFKEFPSVYHNLISIHAATSNIWKKNEFKIHPNKLIPKTYQIYSMEHYLSFVDEGHPNEEDSDICLSEVLNSNCVISSKCWNLMSLDEKSYGYHLTHKLLYFTFLSKNCSSVAPMGQSVAEIIPNLCSEILIETNFISELNFPHLLRDLFMEQVLFCTFNGFSEFIREDWLAEIISWQSSSGCFKYSSTNLTTKMTEEHNCTDHMTGIGVALFAVFGKIIMNY